MIVSHLASAPCAEQNRHTGLLARRCASASARASGCQASRSPASARSPRSTASASEQRGARLPFWPRRGWSSSRLRGARSYRSDLTRRITRNAVMARHRAFAAQLRCCGLRTARAASQRAAARLRCRGAGRRTVPGRCAPGPSRRPGWPTDCSSKTPSRPGSRTSRSLRNCSISASSVASAAVKFHLEHGATVLSGRAGSGCACRWCWLCNSGLRW